MAGSRDTHGEYRADIDGLRAVAVVPVVLYHAGWFALPGGFIGVDIFFVISGFLITRIIDRELAAGKFSILNFYERRARRILPALFVVIFATLVGGWLFLFPQAFVDLANSIVATVFFGSNFYFLWTTDYFSPLAEFRPMLHTWSLAVEEQFYVLFPLFLMLLRKISARAEFVGVVTVFIVSIVACIVVTEWMPRAAFYMAPTRAWELMLGAMLALGVVPAWRKQSTNEIGAGIGILAILIPIVLFSRETPFPGIAALLPCFGTALLIQAGRDGSTEPSISRVLSSKAFVFIGLISYSLYLWHWPILAFLRIHFRTPELSPFVSTIGVSLALLLATFSWRFVEKPFRRKQRISRRQIIFSASCAAVALLAASAAIKTEHGFAGRFSMPVLQALDGAKDEVRSGCRSNEAWEHRCVYGSEQGEPTILVWGDSHAAAVVPAVAYAAKPMGSSVLYASHSACAPLLGVRKAKPYNWRKCQRLNSEVVEFLTRRAHSVETVILVARWPFYVPGAKLAGETGPEVVLIDEDDSAETGNPRLMEKGLSNTVELLLNRGFRVMILGAVPEIGWNVPLEIAYSRETGNPHRRVPTIDDVNDRQGASEFVLQQVANRFGVAWIPVAPLLCQPDCLVEKEGQPVFFDGDHLSIYGAANVLGPKLAPLLSDLLQ